MLGAVDTAVVATAVRLKLPTLRHEIWNAKWRAAIDRMSSLFHRAGGVLDSDSVRPVEAERAQSLSAHPLDLRGARRNTSSRLTNYAHGLAWPAAQMRQCLVAYREAQGVLCESLLTVSEQASL
jgi:hypothetical protein